MGFLDSLKAWFRTESEEARQIGRETKSRLEADLDRREAELSATPAEKLDSIRDRIAEDDATFGELRDEIERRAAGADATAEVADLAGEGDGPDPGEGIDPTTA